MERAVDGANDDDDALSSDDVDDERHRCDLISMTMMRMMRMNSNRIATAIIVRVRMNALLR